MSDNADYFAHEIPTRYENDRRQAMLFLVALAFAAILSVVMIIWAVLV
jgi:hypothetical protein